MVDPIFTDRQRTDTAPIRAGESEFAFLDRCAWPAADVVRQAMSFWISRYPACAQPVMARRLQCGDNREFSSASFELVLHEYLVRLGMKLTPHPKLINGKEPDFLVECPDGQSLYLEAVGASEYNGTTASAEAMKALALRAVDELVHPDFILAVRSSGDPKTQPSARQLAEAVARWLGSLDACIARAMRCARRRRASKVQVGS